MSEVIANSSGVCTILANQGGNAAYNAAPTVSQSFQVSSKPQSITFGSLPAVMYGVLPFNISASATSSLTVSFSSNSGSVCTVSGSTVTVGSVGTCSITANQAGNGIWAAAPAVTQTFNIAKQNQTINFSALPDVAMGTTPILSASATSGQPVSFSSPTGLVCTVHKNVVTLLALGTCTVNANQPGNSNVNAAAQVALSFSVTPGTQPTSSSPIPVPIAAPYINNPMAGSLPGELGVSASGTSTYSLPIALPPGTAGMVPNISLDYDSDNTTGSAGLGWSLGGVSNIDRCGRTIATNNVADAVRMTAQDRLCLNGQRLILVGDDNDNNAYWAANAEYRTELESFSRITAQGLSDNRSYLLEARDGRKSYFGATTDSKVLNNSTDYVYLDPAYTNTGKIHRWRQNQSVDLRGNTIDYVYQQSANGENKPLEIRWGKNPTAGQSHYAKVRFSYEDRALDDGSKEVRNSYVAGGEAFEALRLKTIVTSTDTDADGVGGATVHSYTLDYQTSPTSRRSLLWKVQVCDGAQKCLPETVFSWGKPKAGAAQGFVPLGGGSGERSGPNLGALATDKFGGAYGPVRSGFDTVVFSDFNGDGRADILERYRGSPNGSEQTLYTSNADGSGFTSSKPFAGIGGGLAVMEAGDFDGDGVTDVLVSDGGQALGNWRICKGNGGATAQFACGAALAVPSAAANGNSVTVPRIVRDFNADGRADIFFNGGDAVPTQGIPAGPHWMCLSTGSGFSCESANDKVFDLASDAPSGYYSSGHDSADIDGDGRVEEIQLGRCKRIPKATSGFTWDCGAYAISNNGGIRIRSNADPLGYRQYGWWQPFTKTNQIIVPAAESGSVSADLSADGYTDMVLGNAQASSNGTLYGGWGTTCFGKGNGTANCLNLPASDVPEFDHLIMTLGDFDGDGLYDVLRPAVNTGVTADVSSYRLCKVRPMIANGALAVTHSCKSWSGPVFRSLSLSLRLDESGDGDTLSWDAPRSGFLGDFDGDGRADVVTYMGKNYAGGGDKWQIWGTADQGEPGKPLDKLVSVQDGYGRIDSVTYAATGDASVYVQTATDVNGAAIVPVYPVKATANTRRLVKTVTRETGEGRTAGTSYSYAGYAVHAQGRGNLGFARMDVTDELSSIVTTTWARQDYPFAGMAAASVRRAGSCQLSRTENVYAQQSVARGAVAATTFPYLWTSTSSRKELGGCEDMGTVSTTNVYGDTYGNLTSSTSATTLAGEILTTATVTSYINSTAPWVLGLPDLATVTKTTPIGGVQSRAVKRTYLDSLLDTETTQPDEVAVKVKKKHERNALGLVRAVQLSWTDPATGQAKSRYSSTQGYDSRNRFVTSLTNALNQTETRDFDHGTGTLKSVTSIDGLLTTLRFDAFGRAEYEAAPGGNEVHTYERQCSGACPSGAVSVIVKDTRNGTDAIAVPVVSYRDSAGHVLRTDTWGFDGRLIISEVHYDGRGRETDAYWPRFDGEAAFLAKHTEYDDLNRVVKIVTKDEGNNDVTATNSYQGPSVTMTNGKLHSKTEVRDGWNRLRSSTDAKRGLTSYEHDGFDNLTKTTDPKLNVVTVGYNSMGVRTDLRDPDLGWNHYDVDPLGRVWRQVSPMQRKLNRSTTMEYDELDRMTARAEPDLRSYWRYDVAEGQSDCVANHSCGKLVEADTRDASANKTYTRKQTYDVLGRPDLTTTTFDLSVYTSRNYYDTWNRPIRVEHQRGSGAIKAFDQRYNINGYLARIERGGVVLWRAMAQDAANRVTQARLGNLLDVVRVYDPYTGRLTSGSVAGTQGPQLQEGYQYDVLGNVKQRTQYWPGADGFIEDFDYDELNRLTLSRVGTNSKTYRYDAIGNMVNKPDVSASDYVYPASGANSVRPHAVSSIPGFGSFTYDDNGNLLTDATGRQVDWTSFDMPSAMTKGSEKSEFTYGPEHQRTRQIRTGSLPATIQYAGAMEVEIAATGTTVKTYWPASLGVDIDRPNASTTELSWTHADRLGSIVGVTGETGALRAGSRMAYDAWGMRRELNTNTPNAAINGVVDNKGFTGHEMLDQLDLVHMNGRVYDPFVARFMSADPIIQDPEHSQSYNRYAYVWNNPTNLTDPTGFAAQNPGAQPEKPACDMACEEMRKRTDRCRASANCDILGATGYENNPKGSADPTNGAGNGAKPPSTGGLLSLIKKVYIPQDIDPNAAAEWQSGGAYEYNQMGDPVNPDHPGVGAAQIAAGSVLVGGLGAVGVGYATGSMMPYGLSFLDTLLTGSSREMFVRWWANKLPEVLSLNARTEAKTVAEQMALKAAKAGEGVPVQGMSRLGDPRLEVGQWTKMQVVVRNAAEKVIADVHYVQETLTKVVKDFKFK